MGISQKDEPNLANTAGICQLYNNYMPQLRNEQLSPVIVYGAQRTVDCIQGMKEAKMYGYSPRDRLEGLVPAVQDWDFRKLLLQVLH